MMLQPGDPVPEFSALSDNGKKVQLSAWRGQPVVVFFFPNAAATHCQMQARRFQALAEEFQALNVQLLGISVDSRSQQATFREICKLSFPLIADSDYRLSEQFGVLTSSDDEEKKYARRVTFLIGPQGEVRQRWDDVNPNTNASEVLAALHADRATS
ncbi:peroxiredoxin [Deinococcus irradiatisoli]|uniref:thioredoxin-dependent peroxiredoxin n=1 Tax=Deinococcus irradiatisoli TaxID=2202254 RepID=A0A2Z3JFX1_9DEIO|nr:peroxiredoxin [Deinococcus irradiatisoli]AWN24087.1 peroxiredoxin [Deinococcus irradiatisoli]